MQELSYQENSNVLHHKDKVISFKCELQENLQKAMKQFVEAVSYTHLRAHET